MLTVGFGVAVEVVVGFVVAFEVAVGFGVGFEDVGGWTQLQESLTLFFPWNGYRPYSLDGHQSFGGSGPGAMMESMHFASLSLTGKCEVLTASPLHAYSG